MPPPAHELGADKLRTSATTESVALPAVLQAIAEGGTGDCRNAEVRTAKDSRLHLGRIIEIEAACRRSREPRTGPGARWFSAQRSTWKRMPAERGPYQIVGDDEAS